MGQNAGPDTAPAGLGHNALVDPIKQGVQSGARSGRASRYVVGSGVVEIDFRVPLEAPASKANREFREYLKRESAKAIFQRDTPPLNIIGGYRFPEAPHVGLSQPATPAPPKASAGPPIDRGLDIPTFLRRATYTPVSFWDDQTSYLEVAVEKLDLRNLFEPTCAEFHIPIQNFKGWSDLNARAALMRRFAEHEAAGRRCVLLLCGDHDPGGLHITDKMRKNLSDLSGAVGWTPENLIISRFGLNADFIDRHGLTWIDNLETSSGQQLDDPNHEDHDKRYVQDYIAHFGVRKCEANALVVVPEIGRQLCRAAILQFIPAEAPARYQRKLARERKKLRQEISRQMRAAP
jgi:hypothetical protein